LPGAFLEQTNGDCLLAEVFLRKFTNQTRLFSYRANMTGHAAASNDGMCGS
jgi:hypothetical protein